MDVTVPFDPGAAGLVLVQASPELTSNMSFPFYKPVWTSTESLYLHSLYLYSRFLYSIHHSQSSQSISIYDRGIGAKISVSISISRFLRLENLVCEAERLAVVCFVCCGGWLLNNLRERFLCS